MKDEQDNHGMNPLPSGSLLFHERYRVLRVLGQGGFGITYEAEQTALGRRVAVKEFFLRNSCERKSGSCHVSSLSSSLRANFERYKVKFLKEARVMAEIVHPNIVRIIDLFEENGTAYYVMEYLPGGSLNDLIRSEGSLDLSDALKYIREVASALSYLHEHRINHLDVKPSNILINRDGQAVLIDFGLSKHYDSDGNETSSTPVGISEGYAPIEQYSKEGVRDFSPSTDIYGLGATFYFLLSGKRPAAAAEILNSGLSCPSSSIPEKIWGAISSAMNPSRLARPQNISDFLQLLDEVYLDESPERTIENVVIINDGNPSSPSTLSTKQQKDELNVVNPLKSNKFSVGDNHKAIWLVIGLFCFIIICVVIYFSFPFVNGSFSDSHDGLESDKSTVAIVDSSIAISDTSNSLLSDTKEESDHKVATIDIGEHVSVDKDIYDEEQGKAEEQNKAEVVSVVEEQSNTEEQRKAEEQNKAEAARIAEERRKAEEARLAEEQRKAEELRRAEEARRKDFIEVVDDVAFDMVYVSEGSFFMGSDYGELDERPIHEVSLDGYHIGRHEVTQEIWKRVMGNNPSNFKGDDLPVENVSWYDVQAFISRLNQLTGKKYRLPTEAEWEYAARGGIKSKETVFSGSESLLDVGWFSDNSNSRTHPVGKKTANELGLYDMSGNVCEWCSDWYADYNSLHEINPKGSPEGEYKVLRGGSWFSTKGGCRSSFRIGGEPGFKRNDFGFRLAVTL